MNNGSVYKNPKISDLSFGTVITGTAAIAGLISVPQGTNITDRTGSRLIPLVLDCQVTISPSTTLVGSALSNIRMLIVQDTQQVQGFAPTITDVINPSNVVGQPNVYFLQRFRILKEVKTQVSSYIEPYNKSWKVKLPKDVIAFASGLATDISTNGIYLIYVSDNSTNPPNLVWSSRLYFANP